MSLKGPGAWHAELRARVGTLDIELELKSEGGVLALIGPNGSGKTSVLRLITGAAVASHAVIEIGNEALAKGPVSTHLPIEARGLGYVPQGYGLFGHLNVLDNVAFGLRCAPKRHPRARARELAAQMLAHLDCASLVGRRVHMLSGGEQQRVALARALVVDPKLVLLDEPLAALDAVSRRRVRGFLAQHLREQGRPTLLVTHDARDIDAFDAHVCVMAQGKVVQRGSAAQLRAAPANEFVAEFFGD